MVDLIHWEPYNRLMRRFFDDFTPFRHQGSLMPEGLDFVPAVDVNNGEDRFELSADLPGMKKDDIDVSVDNGILTLKGERKQEAREEKDGTVHTERSFGYFERRIALPEGTDEENLKASFTDGVLTISAPRKALKAPEKKQVTVS